ncbi:hypothetical protein ACQVP2_07365 [Methylobacterium aquaticum]|uniref:hypothetical protein n=1 Tax=Methylobacterium aquaticum TaxID=270351 RepID=UPI003D177652
MLKKIKTLMGLAQRDDATAADLRASLLDAESEVAAARQAVAAAEGAYTGALLSADDAGLRGLQSATADAKTRLARAEAIQGALRGKLEDAEAYEAEMVRRQRYDAALAQAEEARRTLHLYPQMAADLVALLETVARAEIAIAEANADLPEGVPELQGVEATVRSIPGKPRRVARQVKRKLWCREDTRRPEVVDEATVKPGPSPDHGFFYSKIAGTVPVVRREVLMKEIVAAVPARPSPSLAGEINLPAFLPGQWAPWSKLEYAIPSSVLSRIAERAGHGNDDALSDPDPLPVVEMEFVGDAPPKPEPKRGPAKAAAIR